MGLREDILNCKACSMWDYFKQPVPFEGDPHAELMFIGRDPGAEEVKLLRPFIGPAGQVFRQEVLKPMGIPEDVVYISNIVCCRPLNNIAPGYDVSWPCADRHVYRAVNEVRPKVIVTLGKEAAEYCLGYPARSMTSIRGKTYTLSTRFSPIPIIPTWHPSYIMRLQSINPAEAERHRHEMINDVSMALRYCETLRNLV